MDFVLGTGKGRTGVPGSACLVEFKQVVDLPTGELFGQKKKKKKQAEGMWKRPIQIVGLLLCLLGWGFVGCSLVMDRWRYVHITLHLRSIHSVFIEILNISTLLLISETYLTKFFSKSNEEFTIFFHSKPRCQFWGSRLGSIFCFLAKIQMRAKGN